MIQPEPLRPGAHVYLVNTARHLTDFPTEAIAVLESWGLRITIGESLNYEAYGQFAAPDEIRLRDLQRALDDETVRAVFFARGGYGSVRILDSINWERFLQSPKWLIGYSDITYFHNVLNTLSCSSIHASMLSDYSDKQANEQLWNCLSQPAYSFKSTYQWALRPQAHFTGTVMGGNLSILYAQLGSPTALNPKDGILVFEDIFENLMVIERMLYNLRRNGVFEQCKAVVFGTLTLPLDNSTSNAMSPAFALVTEENKEAAIQDMLTRFFQQDAFPVYYGIHVGHEKGKNWPLRLTAKANISDKNGELLLQYN